MKNKIEVSKIIKDNINNLGLTELCNLSEAVIAGGYVRNLF